MSRLAVINGFDNSQLFSVLLNEVSQSEEAITSLNCVHCPPGSLFKGSSGSMDSSIDISSRSPLDLSKNSLISWIDDVKSLVFDGVDESSVDEELFDKP